MAARAVSATSAWRTRAAAAIVFLHMNDVELDNDEDGLVDITVATSEGRASKKEVADFFRSIAL